MSPGSTLVEYVGSLPSQEMNGGSFVPGVAISRPPTRGVVAGSGMEYCAWTIHCRFRVYGVKESGQQSFLELEKIWVSAFQQSFP